ncbi:MAG: hypothetical protein AABX38_02480 [Candidatus Micrarchaeota archaeon]
MIKENLFRKLFEIFKVNGQTLVTRQLWSGSPYWQCVLDLIDNKEMPYKAKQNNERFQRIKTALQTDIKGSARQLSEKVFDRLADFEPSSFYTLFEVAEAKYFREISKYDSKIGPESEEPYDRFIREFMPTIQLYQPIYLDSTLEKTSRAIPYMTGKWGGERVYLTDSKEDLLTKVYKASQRTDRTPVFWKINGYSAEETLTINPFARLTIFALESARIVDCLPLRLGNRSIYSSEEALEFLDKSGSRDLPKMAGVVGEAIWNYILRPVQQPLIKKYFEISRSYNDFGEEYFRKEIAHMRRDDLL